MSTVDLRGALITAVLTLQHACGLAAPTNAVLHATTSEPRAFGYQVGDTLSRTITIHVPDGLTLDNDSVPLSGVRGKALELRSVSRHDTREPGGRRIDLTFVYQTFLSAPQTRTLETPTLTLAFKGVPRNQDLRIEPWPVTVSPLAPVDISPRRGLGELQPDAEPGLIDTTAGQRRLVAYGLVLLLLSGYLACVYIGLPWWSRTHRPFSQAWRAMGGLQTDAPTAFQRLHDALNQSAGEVVFAPGIDRFVAAQPHFLPLRDDLVEFFGRSRNAFFGQRGHSPDDILWLTAFSRRCRNVERGSA